MPNYRCFLFWLLGGDNLKFYTYEGPVMMFGICLADRWKGETWASSMKKARSNLTFQFKRQTNRLGTSNIYLSGEIKEGSPKYGFE